MTCHSENRCFLVGIEYDSPFEDQGYFDLKRTVTLNELAQEVINIQRHGHSYPTFPASANPSVLFVWDLNDPDDGDCYHVLVEAIKKLKIQKGVKVA